MKWMPVRKFLRGGYKTIEEPTVITSQGYPIFTVMPAAGAQIRTLSATMGGTHGFGQSRPIDPSLRDLVSSEEADVRISFSPAGAEADVRNLGEGDRGPDDAVE
jgi:hypothetical protein